MFEAILRRWLRSAGFLGSPFSATRSVRPFNAPTIKGQRGGRMDSPSDVRSDNRNVISVLDWHDVPKNGLRQLFVERARWPLQAVVVARRMPCDRSH